MKRFFFPMKLTNWLLFSKSSPVWKVQWYLIVSLHFLDDYWGRPFPGAEPSVSLWPTKACLYPAAFLLKSWLCLRSCGSSFCDRVFFSSHVTVAFFQFLVCTLILPFFYVLCVCCHILEKPSLSPGVYWYLRVLTFKPKFICNLF